MNITIAKDALQWFKQEFILRPEDAIRFFVRYGGSSTIQDGFSLGMTVDTKRDPEVETEVEGIGFFIEREDIWYFKGLDLEVLLDDRKEEIEFRYV